MQTYLPIKGGRGPIARQGRDPRNLTVALVALLLVLVWGLVGLLLHLQHSDADRASTRRAQALANTLSPQVENRISRLETLAGTLLARINPDSGPEDFQRLVAETDMPEEVQQLSLADHQGQVIASTPAPARDASPALLIEARGQPLKQRGMRVIVHANASRLLALAAGTPFRLEGTALLARDDGPMLGAFPDTVPFETAGQGAPPGWPTAADDVRRQWASSDLPRQRLRLLVAVTDEEVLGDLQRRATLIVAAAAIESVVAVALAVLVLAQARRRDRLLHRLEIGRRRLRAANLAKTRFLQSISHELRTPLNGVLCTSELMVQMALSDEQAEVADIICQSASDLAGMIDMLIDIAELQSGSATATEARADLREIIEKNSKTSLSSIWARGGSLTLRWAPGLATWLLLDPPRFAVIVRTLLDAAGNVYSSPAVTLTARLESPGELSLKVCVRPVPSPDAEPPVRPAFLESSRGVPGDDVADGEDLKATLGLLLLQDLVTTLGGRLVVSTPGAEVHEIDVRLPVRAAEDDAR